MEDAVEEEVLQALDWGLRGAVSPLVQKGLVSKEAKDPDESGAPRWQPRMT